MINLAFMNFYLLVNLPCYPFPLFIFIKLPKGILTIVASGFLCRAQCSSQVMEVKK